MEGKSYNAKSDIAKYVYENSVKLLPAQQKLYDATLQHKHGGMMGDPICLSLMGNLMKCMGAKRVLDVGVFTGVSSLHAALSIPENGQVVALDVSEEFTNVGKPYWEEAGVSKKIDLIIAPALESLDKLIADGESGNFDFAFIDADKGNYCNYFDRCLKLVRSGGIIAFDNVLWGGQTANPSNNGSNTVALRKLNDMVKESDKVNSTMLNVGDGLTLAFVK